MRDPEAPSINNMPEVPVHVHVHVPNLPVLPDNPSRRSRRDHNLQGSQVRLHAPPVRTHGDETVQGSRPPPSLMSSGTPPASRRPADRSRSTRGRQGPTEDAPVGDNRI